jgi:hypothetical protein
VEGGPCSARRGKREGADFVRERALRILRGQVGQVVKGLRQMVTKRKHAVPPLLHTSS